MKIVIDIPKSVIEHLKDGSFGARIDDRATLIDAVMSGTPLPEHHGRLIDADELYGDFIDGTEGYDCQTWNRIEIGEIIDDAPTIIEADRGE